MKNTFPSGIGRELASDYHAFVAELGILAAVDAAFAGRPLSDAVWQRLCAMFDSGAALLDERCRPPRQGDGDEGRALLLSTPADSRWPSLLATGQALFGRPGWWPEVTEDSYSVIVGALAGSIREVSERPEHRPARFADAGLTILHAVSDGLPEIWCRCDGGPHGYLSIAAHAHADALSVEVRHGGVDILADPGTYCYHGEPQWRSYFRSTIAHNTVEIAGRSQSAEGGPFLWLRHANASEISAQDDGDSADWAAEHSGYQSLVPPARHRRRVRLDRGMRTVEIADEIDGGEYAVRMAFHLGPEVQVQLDGTIAALRWPGSGARQGAARLELPGALEWSLHRGGVDPILGWYSDGLGRRRPAFALIGSGRAMPARRYVTRLNFLDACNPSI